MKSSTQVLPIRYYARPSLPNRMGDLRTVRLTPDRPIEPPRDVISLFYFISFYLACEALARVGQRLSLNSQRLRSNGFILRLTSRNPMIVRLLSRA